VILGGFSDVSEFTKMHAMSFQSAVAQTTKVSPAQVILGDVIIAQAVDMRWMRRLASVGIEVPYTIDDMSEGRMESAKHALEAVAQKPASFQRTLSNQLSAANVVMPEGGLEVAAIAPVAASYSPAPTPVPTAIPTAAPTEAKSIMEQALDSATIGGIAVGSLALLAILGAVFYCGRASTKSTAEEKEKPPTSFVDLEGSLADVATDGTTTEVNAGESTVAVNVPMAATATAPAAEEAAAPGVEEAAAPGVEEAAAPAVEEAPADIPMAATATADIPMAVAVRDGGSPVPIVVGTILTS
jgi:hypothetical protein